MLRLFALLALAYPNVASSQDAWVLRAEAYGGFRCHYRFHAHVTYTSELTLRRTGESYEYVSGHPFPYFELVYTPEYMEETEEPQTRVLATRLACMELSQADGRIVNCNSYGPGARRLVEAEIVTRRYARGSPVIQEERTDRLVVEAFGTDATEVSFATDSCLETARHSPVVNP